MANDAVAQLDDLDAEPLPAGDEDRLLTEGRAIYGIWAPLYDESYWGLLDSAVSAALDGDGTDLLRLSDAYTSRGPSGRSASKTGMANSTSLTSPPTMRP